MRKSRFTEGADHRLRKQAHAGRPVTELYHHVGIMDTTVYK